MLATPFDLTHWKNFNVTVDNTNYAENVYVPGQPDHFGGDSIPDLNFWNVTYEFDVVADNDGIDIEFSRGCTTGAPVPSNLPITVNQLALRYEQASQPLVNALSITAVPETSSFLLLGAVLMTVGGLRPICRTVQKLAFGDAIGCEVIEDRP